MNRQLVHILESQVADMENCDQIEQIVRLN